jgi:hypothetical protein
VGADPDGQQTSPNNGEKSSVNHLVPQTVHTHLIHLATNFYHHFNHSPSLLPLPYNPTGAMPKRKAPPSVCYSFHIASRCSAISALKVRWRAHHSKMWLWWLTWESLCCIDNKADSVIANCRQYLH